MSRGALPNVGFQFFSRLDLYLYLGCSNLFFTKRLETE